MTEKEFLRRIDEADGEARRFLRRLTEFYEARASGELPQFWAMCGSAETAALKRASLDLTRSLARLRAR